jgi:hypothetical protein
VRAEAVATGFELGELAIDGVRGHGDSRQEYLMACLRSVNLAGDARTVERETSGLDPSTSLRAGSRDGRRSTLRIVHLFLTCRSSTVNPSEMGAQ